MAKGIKVTPAQSALKWKQHLDNAGDQIKLGVERVTVAPGVLAAAQEEKFRVNILKSIDNHRWANEVKRVTLTEWQDKMINIGLPRIRAGTEAAVPEVEEFAAKLFPHIEAGQAALEKMPSVSLSDNIDRMVSFVTHMSHFSFRGGS